MGFTDSEMRFLNDYDRWKTTPDDCEDEEPIAYCYECGEPIYYDDDSWEFDGNTYCENCVSNHKQSRI